MTDYLKYEVRVTPEGAKFWYLNGELHREDGPAEEWDTGDKFWCLNGELHREDGPAVEYEDGTKKWYLNGDEVTEQDVIGKTMIGKRE